jgi:hypothetical protein
MRTETDDKLIHELAVALLKRRGVDPARANYDQYSDAASIAAEAVARGKTTVPEMLAVAALGDTAETDKKMLKVLSKFASDGRFVADLSLSEQELLEAAVIAAEAADECEHGYQADEDGNGRADGCPDCA